MLRRSVFLSCLCLLTMSQTISPPVLGDQPWYNPASGPPGNKAQANLIYQRALQAFQSQDYHNCVQLCKAALNYDHGNKYIVQLEAVAHSEAGETYDAMRMFRAALALDYNFVQCRNSYAIFLRKVGKTEEAMHNLEECTKINPNYPDPYYHLGEIYKEKGDLDAAINFFNTAIRLNPNYWEAQRDLGLALYEKYSSGQVGSIADSVEKLKKAEQLVPDNPLIHYYLGKIYCAKGSLDDAESEFRKALMNDPRLAAAHFELGQLRYLRGDPDRCLLEMQETLKISPVYSESKKYPLPEIKKIKQYIAKCYELQGRYPQAIDMWREVAAIEKNNQEIAKRIQQDEKKARAQLKLSSKLTFDPQEVEALIAKGIGQEEDGELDGAQKTFERALELNAKNFRVLQNLGSLAEARGDANGAMARYREAMAVEPDYDGLYFNFGHLLERMNLPGDAGSMYYEFEKRSGRFPYDPKHFVEMRQEQLRQQIRDEQIKKRGY